MEVHHHSHLASGEIHTARKKWTHYFWEFLMLFLAVFCGFLAEYQLEHKIEHKRVRQYAALLIADLEKDTTRFNNENILWLQRQQPFDSLISLLIQPEPASDERVLKKLLAINYVSDAKLNAATYNQMKTSGSLRYINNINLISELEDYYEIRIPRAIESSQSTIEFFNSYIKTFFIDHLRNQDMKAQNDTMKKWSPVIFGRSREADQRLSNIVDMARTHLSISNRFYKSANSKAIDLIALIRNEYHLK